MAYWVLITGSAKIGINIPGLIRSGKMGKNRVLERIEFKDANSNSVSRKTTLCFQDLVFVMEKKDLFNNTEI